MDIKTIFSDTFDYTRKMFTDLGRLIILIVLDIIPIVNFIVVGYAAKTVVETPSSKEPPILKGYRDMWIQGLKIVVASLIWMIIPIILIGVGFGLGAWSPSFYGFPAMLGASIALGVIGIAVAFIIAIILCMAIVHMIKHNSFSKAFAVGEVIDIIGRIGWGKYLLWLIIIFVIGIVIAGIGSIPFVGWVISLIIGPLFSVFAARSASLTYLEGTPTQTLTPTPTALPSGAKYCSNCGESLPPDAIFCPKCGQKIS